MGRMIAAKPGPDYNRSGGVPRSIVLPACDIARRVWRLEGLEVKVPAF